MARNGKTDLNTFYTDTPYYAVILHDGGKDTERVTVEKFYVFHDDFRPGIYAIFRHERNVRVDTSPVDHVPTLPEWDKVQMADEAQHLFPSREQAVMAEAIRDVGDVIRLSALSPSLSLSLFLGAAERPWTASILHWLVRQFARWTGITAALIT